MNVALPRSLKEFVQDEVQRSGYSSASEYVRALIRAARRRIAEEELEALIREGIESGPAVPITPEFWEERRQEALKRAKAREAK